MNIKIINMIVLSGVVKRIRSPLGIVPINVPKNGIIFVIPITTLIRKMCIRDRWKTTRKRLMLSKKPDLVLKKTLRSFQQGM